jgi:hypothetical protein
MSLPTPFTPTLDAQRLSDLRSRISRACDELKERPNSVAPFESDKERFGEPESGGGRDGQES